jgi:hypothetical protein
MLDLANDIRSLSDFKRNTVDLLERLRKTGHPLVLTINGNEGLCVRDDSNLVRPRSRLNRTTGSIIAYCPRSLETAETWSTSC